MASLKNLYVAYIDVLGYKSIIDESGSDYIAYRRLHSIFEVFINAYDSSFLIDETGGDLYRDVKRMAFSDSIYLSSESLLILLDMLQSLFSAVYIHMTNVYEFSNNDWMPYIRAGIEYGWVEFFRDPTIPGNLQSSSYRNPVGSGISKAYLFTEDSPALPGMRIFFRKALLQKPLSSLTLNLPQWFSNIRKFYVDEVPGNEKLLEVYWPLEVISNSNCDFHKMLTLTREQFFSQKSYKHYNATLELFAKSIQVSGDSHAQNIWSQSSNLLCPL